MAASLATRGPEHLTHGRRPRSPTWGRCAASLRGKPAGRPIRHDRSVHPQEPAGRRGHRSRRLRAVLAQARPGWPGRALYCALTVPLAMVYAALFLGLVASVVLSVQGVGVLLFLVLLAVTRGLGGVERSLARSLLGVDVAPAGCLRREPGRLRRLRLLVLDSGTWRTLGWLGARVLLGAGVLATLVFGATGWAVLITEAPWNAWSALALLLVMAVIAVAVLVALDVQVRLTVLIAPRLLGVAPEEQLAELRRASQRLADRNRLARDLHDTIGHSLTASLLQATAARRTLTPSADDPARPVSADFARQALEHIEVNTRTALAELDRALAVLRDDPAGSPAAVDPAHTPELGDLAGLLAGLRDGGLPVLLTAEGDLEELPPAVGELAYRVVQEGTTNVLRHAGCPATTIGVSRTGHELSVRVRNGPALLDGRVGPGGGRGLAGLSDRAAAAGGRLVAGPTPEGGFEVWAVLPLPVPV